MPISFDIRTWLLAVLLGMAGCSDPSGPTGFEFLIQVRAISAPAAPDGQVGPAPVPGALDGVEIEQAVVVFGGLTLDGSSRSNTADWVHDETVVVPLRLSGDPTLAFAPAVGDGEYERLGVTVDKLEASDPQEAALIEVFPRIEGLSLLVEGRTLDEDVSEPFIFTTSIPAIGHLEFSQPRTFTSEGAALPVYTVIFNLDRWFETAGGLVLDPNDEADRDAIEESIFGTMDVVKGSGN